MSDVTFLRKEAADLMARGDHPQAIRLLEHRLEATRDPGDRVALLTDLVNASVRVSWHRKGLEHARMLEASLPLPRFHRFRARLASLFVAAGYLSPSARLSRLFVTVGRVLIGARSKALREIPWSALRAVQFAHFWNDIERCVHYAIQQVTVAKSPAERSASFAWLGYAMAYRGISWMSVSVIRKAIREAEQIPGSTLPVELYPLLGLALLMTGDSEAANRSFEDYDRTFDDASEFYKLLTLTARINMHIADGNLAEAEKAIGRCFSYSFAMSKSRHHIQIYGGSAALAAAEGRRGRALRDLRLSESAAEANDNALDCLIHYRYAVLVHLNLRDAPAAEAALEKMAQHLAAYGGPLWYREQYERMRGLIARERWSFVGALSVWVKCLGYSVASFNLHATGRLLRKARIHLFVERRQYWSPARLTAYFQYRLEKLPEETKQREGADFSEKVSEAILDLGEDAAPRPDDLEELVSRVFPDVTVLSAETLKGLVDAARVLVDTHGFTIFDDRSQTIRVPCQDGRFLLGLVVPKLHEGAEDKAVGLLTAGLDVHSVSFAEAALRLVVSDFASLAATRALEERRAKDRELVAVGAAAQALAHDIRRPFSLVKAGLSVLAQAATVDEFQRGVAQLNADVTQSLDRVNAMIADVIQAGSPLHLERDTVHLGDLVESLVDATVRSLAEPKAVVTLGLAHARAAFADRVKLGRALENVLVNAFQAAGASGRIWIRSRDVDQTIELTIGNDGPRISPAQIAQIFEPFFTSGKRGGTGLGLAITRNVLRAHGGDVACASTDEGVEFTFRIPAADSVPTLPRKADGIVALADDSPFVLEAWKRALTGIPVKTYLQGEALLGALKEDPALRERLTCIVTDFHFGEGRLTGLDVLTQSRELLSGVPVILASDGEFTMDVRRRFDRVIGKMAVDEATVSGSH